MSVLAVSADAAGYISAGCELHFMITQFQEHVAACQGLFCKRMNTYFKPEGFDVHHLTATFSVDLPAGTWWDPLNFQAPTVM
jgi:hypothetical protein